jgi:hypothetical protein
MCPLVRNGGLGGVLRANCRQLFPNPIVEDTRLTGKSILGGLSLEESS